MSKKIFITGVAGFLGSHLADRMFALGHRVAGCDNLIGGYRDNVPEGVEFFEADCADVETMKELLKGTDTVYHTAAIATEGLSVFSPYTITRSIVDSTVSVIVASITNKVRRFINCSSMARYGANEVPFTEDMPPNPEDPYGIAKVAAENFLRNLSETFGFEHVTVVPHNIIGTRQKYDDPFRNVVSIMINLMLQGRQPIIYGDGEQKRSFSFISDCISCLERCLDNEEVTGELVNIGPDDNEMTINALAKILADIIGFENLKPIYVAQRPREVRYAYCSANKARRLLQFNPKKNLRDGLVEMVEWIRKRGPKPFQYHLPIEIMNDKTPKTWMERQF